MKHLFIALLIAVPGLIYPFSEVLAQPIPAACTPTTTAYCCGFGITNFSFHTINNTTPDASEGYQDFSAIADTVVAGQSYTVSVSTPTPATHNVRVWIDFNNNGNLNPASELVFSANNSLLATGTIFIPASATLNTALRLRVSADHSLQPAPTPCSNPQFGQAEDYAIYVKPNTSTPEVKFTASDTLSCSGSITFTDQSQNVPTSWLWNFGDGKTSVLQNPIHSYTTSGTYSVSLKATNGNGSSTLTKAHYIHITLGNIPKAASCSPPTALYCCGYGIYKVEMNTINKSSADGIDGYRDYSCSEQATLTEGETYSISIQTNPTLSQDTKVWIDFNNDGIFNQTNELVFTSLAAINPTGNIKIPLGIATYNKVLRMRVSSDNSGANQGPCSTLVKGQVEDYGVTILHFVGTNEIQPAIFSVEVYPNPSNGLFTIQSSVGISSIEVLNILGERVYSSNNGLLTTCKIDLGKQPKGIYFYKLLLVGGNTSAGKIIIE